MAVGNEKKGMSQEQVVQKFNQLRQDQRLLVNKIAELEGEIAEHGSVLEALKDVEGDRKCFRMVGGVLAERTVKEVLPDLERNKAQIEVVVEKLKTQLTEKGNELNAFRAEHNIQIKGEKQSEAAKSTGPASSGVLVANQTKEEVD